METKTPLYTIPEPSTSSPSEVKLEDDGGTLTLSFDYYRDDTIYKSGIRFHGIRAYRYRAEGHCTAWHVEGVYDTLSEVKDSVWVEELRASNNVPETNWRMHHFIIYLDSAGCYEVVARSWEATPEEEGKLGD